MPYSVEGKIVIAISSSALFDMMESADIFCDDYFDIKEIVEFAADFMEKPRRELDYSIWSYMSRKEQRVLELSFDF